MMAATTSTTSATGDNNHYNIVANNKRNDPATPSLFQGDESLDEDDFDDIDIIATDDKCRNNHDNNDNNDDGRGGLNAVPPALASTSSSSSSGSGGSSSELHESSDEGTSGNGRYYNQQNQPQGATNNHHQISSPIPTNTHHQNSNINNNNDNNNNIGKSITPLHNIPYVHGGYAAAAPLFITHSKFATILKRLLPGAYLELKDLLGKSATTTTTAGVGGADGYGGGYGTGEVGDWSGSNDLLQRYSLDNDLIIQSDENKNENGENELPYDWNNSSSRQQPRGKIKGSKTTQQQRGVTMTDPVKIMKWAENNPIVSAFGIWNSDNGRRTKKFMQGVVVVQNGDNVEKNGDGGDSGGVEGGADKEGGERMNLLLRSLSSSAVDPSSAAATDQVEFVQHHDRGNSSVVEAVMTTPGGSSTNTPSDSTQQRLLRHRQRLNQQQQQQQQQSKQRQRKRDANNSSPLPPLPPPPSLASSSRNVSGSSYYSGSGGGGYSPPPPSSLPPGSKLLKGGGISGIGGVSSPRRKVPLPSDLPNTSNSGVLGYPSVDHSLLTRSRSLSFDSANHHLNHQRSTSLHLLPPVVENQLLPSSKQQQKQHYNKPALEWDIFLDPSLVRRVDMALHTVDTLEIQLRKIRMKRERLRQQKLKERRLNGSTTSLEDVDSDDDEEDFDLLQSHTAAQVEVDRLVAQLMRRTIIAHGSMSQLVLEATGWAPEYNFGRVVKCSREGTNLPSPKRRGGNNNKDLTSLSFTETLSWDEEEEQRDFEALLDHKMMGTDGGATGAAGSNTNSAKSGTHHSKGMFMEKWLSLFAKSLSLLVRSTNTSSSGDGMDDDNDIVKLSSSSSSVATRRKRAQDDMLVTKKEKKSATNKAEEEKGLTSYFSSFFFSSEKSSNGVNPEEDGDNDQEEDVANESYLTINDMFSPATTKKSTGILGGLSCGMSLCLGMDDDNERFICGASTGQTSNSVFPLNPHASHQMARDIQRIHDVLGEPLRLVLDLKSRRVPPRVWSRLIDNLRSRGLIVEGIGSFDMDELRVIGKGCSYPLTPILFFHSVGDLQRACHANEVKKGDTVYFNGGSLMWKRSSIMEAAECNACCGVGQMNDLDDDENENDFQSNAYGRTSSTATIATNTSARVLNASGKYSFQPYAYPRSALSDWERVMCKSTIEDYRRHFDLKIGVYVQEFSISAEALDELTVFVNEHGDLYDQGLAFGGVNGVAVKNISGDGYWNQRYMGRSWDFNARPSREMTPLKPEDHHLVQVAIQAGAWGQVGTIYEVNDEQPGALTVPPPREPCKPVHW